MSLLILSSFLILFNVMVHFVAETDGSNIESKQKEDESLLETKFTETLDHSGRFILSWELGEDKSAITFELWAQTVGYIGFGISLNGGMAGADIFIAGVAPDGSPYSSDRYASANELPKIDSREDWTLLEAKENETTTYLKFSRLVDTCDKDEDYPISKDTSRVIWAIGPTDELMKHSSVSDRGTRSISFLSKKQKFNRTGLETWIVESVGFPMPSNDTTYWCSIHEGFSLDTAKYLVAYEPYLNDRGKDYVHHLSLYKCFLPEDGSYDKEIEALMVLNSNGVRGSPCIDIKHKPVHKYCHQEPVLASPKDGQIFALPDDVAFKFEAEPGKKKYFLLEAHLDNPEKSEGVLVNYGFKAFFADKPRKYDAALITVLYANPGLIIPPNTRKFVYRGHCGPACTDNLDPSGISIFYVLLHAHLFATKLKFRHFRNDIELPWIAQEDNFDFNNQLPRVLDEERKVLPGDRLVIECEYDSRPNYNGIIVGGGSSVNEMCEAVIWYYPSNPDFQGCYSNSNEKQTLAPFGISKYNYTGEFTFSRPITIEEPLYLRGDLEDALNDKFNWSEDFIEQFQVRKLTEDQVQTCRKSRLGEKTESIFSIPKNVVEYVPPRGACD